MDNNNNYYLLSNLSVDFESASSAISWEAAWDTTSFTIRFQSSLDGGFVHKSGMVGRSYRDSMLSMSVTQDADLFFFMIY